MILQKRDRETDFEWKLRLIKAKLIEKQDIEWQEIVDILGLDCSADHLRKTSYGILEYDNYLKNNGVATKVLSISDLHIPFNLPVETFKNHEGQIDILVLNGDIQDCQSVSKYNKKYRVNFVEEMILTRQYIIDIIDLLQPKKVIITAGNHENRMIRYLSEKLNDDLLSLMPNSSMDLIINDGFKNNDRRNKTETWYEPLVKVFDNVEIEYTGDWKAKIGKCWFIHPSAYSSGMLKTTEKAANYFFRIDRDFDSIVTAHVHKLGQYVQGDIYMYEQGCCCKIEEMDYLDGKLIYPQQQGYILVCQDIDGSLIYDKTKLIMLD